MIYKYALDRISKQEAQELFKNYTIFEKKFGDRRGIEDIIVSKRRFQYEEEVKVSVTGRHRRACQPGLSPPCVCSKPEVTPRGRQTGQVGKASRQHLDLLCHASVRSHSVGC